MSRLGQERRAKSHKRSDSNHPQWSSAICQWMVAPSLRLHTSQCAWDSPVLMRLQQQPHRRLRANQVMIIFHLRHLDMAAFYSLPSEWVARQVERDDSECFGSAMPCIWQFPLDLRLIHSITFPSSLLLVKGWRFLLQDKKNCCTFFFCQPLCCYLRRSAPCLMQNYSTDVEWINFQLQICTKDRVEKVLLQAFLLLRAFHLLWGVLGNEYNDCIGCWRGKNYSNCSAGLLWSMMLAERVLKSERV